MEDIAADITQGFAMADMDRRARSLSIGTKLYDQIHYSALESLGSITAKQIQMQESIKPFLEMRIRALESLGPIIAKQIQMQESIKPFLEISIKPFLGMQYEAKKSLDVSSINQLELFAHDRSSSIQWPRCGPEISRSEKLCELDSESENRDETDIAQSIQRLLITCNRAKKINGKDAIFKYTDKLRFLCDFGGPLKSQDCEFVWHLKHLRNKWLRHDIEHGNEKSIKSSWKELKEALDFFGLDELPTDIENFKYLHLNILRNAEISLTLMHDAVIENHAS